MIMLPQAKCAGVLENNQRSARFASLKLRFGFATNVRFAAPKRASRSVRLAAGPPDCYSAKDTQALSKYKLEAGSNGNVPQSRSTVEQGSQSQAEVCRVSCHKVDTQAN